MVELRGETLTFRFPEVHEEARCTLSFRRTLRIPDDNRAHALPPGLGNFPLHHVDDHAERLPARWQDHGGVFMPMYQAEAVWISFGSGFGAYPMAVKVAAGKIDALTGDPFLNGLTERPQDYLVVPAQPWLDGFCVRKGLIRQFVAMPMGRGYTAEEQLTGAAEHGGLQIVVYPMKADCYEELRRSRFAIPADVVYPCAAPAAREMGLAPGGLMRQEVYEDEHGIASWEHDVRSRCFVHLLNSAQYREVTGAAPPHEPPTAAEYTRAGLRWFEYYDADRAALEGAPRLARLDSVAARTVKEGDEPLDGASVEPKPQQIRRLGPKRHAVRDGAF